MAYIINIPDSDWNNQKVTLGGDVYTLELRYQDRTQRWYLSIYNSAGDLLMCQKKCVPGFITQPYALAGFTGAILIEHVYGKGDYPSRNNFGLNREFEMKYLTSEEVQAFIDVSKGGVWLNNNA